MMKVTELYLPLKLHLRDDWDTDIFSYSTEMDTLFDDWVADISLADWETDALFEELDNLDTHTLSKDWDV